jgi:hypothetical protein
MQGSCAQEAANKLLPEKYSELVLSGFKPTTRIFMQQNPAAEESKILQRYVQEVIKNALRFRDKSLSFDIIGAEYRKALKAAQRSPLSFEYILSGTMPGAACEGLLNSDCWKAKQKEIEDKIAQQ